MAQIVPSKLFTKSVKQLDKIESERLQKIIIKIIENPQVGKPLKYTNGIRCLRIKPYRLIYMYLEKEHILYLFKFEHRKNGYK